MATSAGTPLQETRFAVVIYGGVSLAVYINGVVQEMLRMVRATAPASPGSATPLVSSPEGTERVYRMLGQMGNVTDTRQDIYDNLLQGTPEPIRTRFVIDVLSGTSAGGINAMFLGKALANNQTLDDLAQLWIREGDIDLLINDARSLDTRLSLQSPPPSLLNGKRMYLKLLEALDKMDAHTPPGVVSLVDDLDLYSTTTDINGLPLEIGLSDGNVTERRHRNVFHFQHPSAKDSDKSDFQSADNPFLAYAARCTSAFPFAFEPMALCDVFPIVQTASAHRKQPYCDPETTYWQRYYTEYIGNGSSHSEPPFVKRAFGDGGYLDNKPFSYAVDAIFRRHADLPVSRKLVYIEPSPEPVRAPRTGDSRPDALENALGALIALPRYETIREDLERVVARNAEIERLTRIIRAVEPFLDAPPSGGEATVWLEGSEDIRQYRGSYAAYERLKIAAVTDDLVDLIAALVHIDSKSSYGSAMRLLAKAWRESAYRWTKDERRFLLEFDVSYRLRRLAYLRRHINEWCRERNHEDDHEAFRDELRRIKLKLRLHDAIRKAIDPCSLEDVRAAARRFPIAELALVIDPPVNAFEKWPRLKEYPNALEDSIRGQEQRADYVLHHGGCANLITDVADVLRPRFENVLKQACADVRACFAAENSPNEHAAKARAAVKEIYDRFEHHDSGVFPITYGHNLGEGERIDVFRISPDDAHARDGDVSDPAGKVKGQALGAFAAFLDESWRRNDLLWGRLDGSERLISILLPGRDPQTIALRSKLIEQAHEAIVEDLCGSSPGNSWREKLRSFIAEGVRKAPEPTLMARSAARATTVTGALLQEIADARRVTGRPFAHLATAGRLIWGLVELSAPRSLGEIAFRYWFQVLLLCALLALVLGIVLGHSVVGLAIRSLSVLIGVFILRTGLRRYLRGKRLVTGPMLVILSASTVWALALAMSYALGAFAKDREFPELMRTAAYATLNGELVASAALVACVALIWAARAASSVTRPVIHASPAAAPEKKPPTHPTPAPRRPMRALQFARTWGVVKESVGRSGDHARTQARRALLADYVLIPAYAILFASLGLVFRDARPMLSWVLIASAIGAASADLLENWAIGKLLDAELPIPFDPDAALARPPRPYAIAKWAGVALSSVLALTLIVRAIAG